MSRKVLVPLVLPADPTQPLEAATKQYVDLNAGGADEIYVGATAPGDTSLLWADTSVTEAGSGVPPGGTTDQVLTKLSATDYDMEWAAATGGLDQATADTRYVNIDGDTMTGPLTLNASPLSFNTWATIFTSAGAMNLNVLGTGTMRLQTNGTTRLSMADTSVVATVPVFLPADPITAMEAASKQYVDAQRDTRQPLDADLTTLAGLTATTDNVIQSVSGAWASRTPAQLKTTLALTKSDVGLANVDNTSDANKPVSTAQAAADALRVLKAGDMMTGPLTINNPSDGTLLSLGWATHSGGLYEMSVDNARTLQLSHGTSGELFMTPTDAGWWTSKPMTINGYNDIRIMSDNTHIEVWADDYIDISMHGWAENVMITQTALNLNSASILAKTNNVTRLTLTDTLLTSTVPVSLPADPASALHAATKQYVDGLAAQATLDARYVNVAGDTLTGPLILAADPSAALGAATKQYVDTKQPFTIWEGTQAEFDALASLDANTYYYVTP